MNLKNAIIDGIKTMRDGSLKITLVTRELDPEQMAELFLNFNEEVMSIEIPDEQEERKSRGQRLRDVLWQVWNKNHKEKFKTFVLYYDHIMEQLIDRYKEKIDNL